MCIFLSRVLISSISCSSRIATGGLLINFMASKKAQAFEVENCCYPGIMCQYCLFNLESFNLFYIYPQLEDKTAFHDEFIQYLKYAMIVYKREPAVENVIDFVTKFATSFETTVTEGQEEEEEEENPFLHFLFNFLLEVKF